MEQGMELSPEQMSEREQRRTEIEQTFLVPVKSTVPSQSVLHQNPIASQLFFKSNCDLLPRVFLVHQISCFSAMLTVF